MKNRTEESYGMLFEALQENFPEARRGGPARMSTDFERSPCPPARKRRKQITYDERIRNLVGRFREIIEQDEEVEDGDVWETGYLRYLRLVGHSARSIYDA